MTAWTTLYHYTVISPVTKQQLHTHWVACSLLPLVWVFQPHGISTPWCSAIIRLRTWQKRGETPCRQWKRRLQVWLSCPLGIPNRNHYVVLLSSFKDQVMLFEYVMPQQHFECLMEHVLASLSLLVRCAVIVITYWFRIEHLKNKSQIFRQPSPIKL